MKTSEECVPCFFGQAERAAREAGADSAARGIITRELRREIDKFSFDACPSEMGRILYRLVRRITGVNDPYAEVKKRSNKLALGAYGQLEKKVDLSPDRLLTALELAIAGNIIDYGAREHLDIDRELKNIMEEEERIIKEENKAVFDYGHFKEMLEGAEKVLYLGDNAGEIVFDKVLLKEIKRYGAPKEIIFAVRAEPIINDALVQDAELCGIDEIARVISSGVDAPGTLLNLCSPEFLDIFNASDMIISKGQGNFEALSGETAALNRPVFFLFVTKCNVSARHIGCKKGNIVLTRIGGGT